MSWSFLSCLGAQWVLQGYKRLAYRKDHGIEGKPVTDFAGAFCCLCCGLMQEEKESLKRGEDKKQMMGGDMGAGYQENPDMAYQQQGEQDEQNPEMAYQQQGEQDEQNPEMAYPQQGQQGQQDEQNPEMAYQQQGQPGQQNSQIAYQ
jgi:PLAC8 family